MLEKNKSYFERYYKENLQAMKEKNKKATPSSGLKKKLNVFGFWFLRPLWNNQRALFWFLRLKLLYSPQAHCAYGLKERRNKKLGAG